MATKTQTPNIENGSWIPGDPGDEISGKVTDVDSAWTAVGDRQYPLLRIDVNGHEVAIHGFRTVLMNEILKKRPEPGETITVKYVGPSSREPRPGQSPAEIFRLIVHGRDPGVTARNIYDQLGGPKDGQAADPDDAPF